jgi:hypothetical protein
VLEIPRKPSVPGFGSLMVNASKETFSDTWLGRSPEQNWIAETIVGFVLGRFSSKLAKIAFVPWRFQGKQAFQVLGSLMVHASEDTLSHAWLGRSPQQNSITEMNLVVVFWHLAHIVG